MLRHNAVVTRRGPSLMRWRKLFSGTCTPGFLRRYIAFIFVWERQSFPSSFFIHLSTLLCFTQNKRKELVENKESNRNRECQQSLYNSLRQSRMITKQEERTHVISAGKELPATLAFHSVFRVSPFFTDCEGYYAYLHYCWLSTRGKNKDTEK